MEKKILMIDDDEEICEEMSEILQDEGYKVTLAFNGMEGRMLVEKDEYDLVILDLKMPGLSGYDVLKAAKAKGVRSKIVVVSGRPFIRKYLPGEDTVDKDRKEDLLKQADGFINKPFDIPKVLATIQELLQQPCLP
jgi:DNA-binding response OmpR family regulator